MVVELLFSRYDLVDPRHQTYEIDDVERQTVKGQTLLGRAGSI